MFCEATAQVVKGWLAPLFCYLKGGVKHGSRQASGSRYEGDQVAQLGRKNAGKTVRGSVGLGSGKSGDLMVVASSGGD